MKLARQLQGLTAAELARDLGVSGPRVSQLERDGSPTDELTFRLATALQVPAAFLYLPDPVVVEEGEIHMRHRARTRASEKALLEVYCSLVAEAVRSIRTRLGELAIIAQADIPRIPVEDAPPDEMESVARQVRRAWGLTDGPIPDLVGLLEEKGVWVHRLPDTLRDVDACSLWVEGEAHVFLVPEARDAEGDRFSLGHECLHLVGHGGVVTGTRQTEAQANRFSGAFLVPASAWLAEAPDATAPEAYVAGSRRWRVSVAALIRRSYDLGILDDDRYRSAMIRLSMGGYRRDEGHLRGASIAEQPRRVVSLLHHAANAGISTDELLGDLALPDNVRTALTGGNAQRVPGRVVPFRLRR